MSRSYEDYRREVDQYLIERPGGPRLRNPFKPRPDIDVPRPRPDAPGGTARPKPDGPDGKPPKKPGGSTVRDAAAGAAGATALDRLLGFLGGELNKAKSIIGDKGAPIEGKEGTKRAHHTKGN